MRNLIGQVTRPDGRLRGEQREMRRCRKLDPLRMGKFSPCSRFLLHKAAYRPCELGGLSRFWTQGALIQVNPRALASAINRQEVTSLSTS